MKRIAVRFFLHFLALAAIFVAWWPVAALFYQSERLLGWDTPNFLYHTVDVSRTLGKLPPAVWEPLWYMGMPRLVDNAWLNFYLIQPLVKVIGPLMAVRIYLLAYFFLFLVFAYFLFHQLSSSRLLSVGLAIITAYSGATHAAFYSAGLVLSFLSQTWSVATFLFLVIFSRSGKLRDLLVASIFFALAMATHPGSTTLFTLPAAILLLFFAKKQRLKAIFIFLFTSGLVGAASIVPHLMAKIIEGGHAWLAIDFARHPETFSILQEATPWMWPVALGITLVGVPLILGFKGRKRSLPFVLIFAYFFLFESALYFGINPLGGFSFPHRFFWLLPISLGAVISSFWFARFKKRNIRSWARLVILGVLTVILVSITLWPEERIFYYDMFQDLPIKKREGEEELRNYCQRCSEIEGEEIVDLHDTDYRLFTLTPMANIFWNLLMPLPQARGTFRYCTSENVDFFVWMDTVTRSENLVKGWIPRPVAKNQTLWLADWHAVRYFYSLPGEGQLADFFFDSDFPIEEKTAAVAGGYPVFFRLPLAATSPIAGFTDVSVLGFVGSFHSYDFFLRSLATLNLNSRYLLPAYLAEGPEGLSQEQLATVDALFFYDYSCQKPRAYQASWEKIERFVEKGGVVFIETGSGAPEKEGLSPASLFPTKRMVRGGLSPIWEITGPLSERLNPSLLSPLEYEGGLWRVTYAEDGDLEEEARVLLRLADKPVIVERPVSEGKVVWSGLNLVYRPHYYQNNALNEAALLREFLGQGLSLEEKKSQSLVERPEAENLIVKGEGKGVLFKENAYRGWQAIVKNREKEYQLSIMPVGVHFMYVRLPPELEEKKVEVVYKYQGQWGNWLSFWLSLVALPGVVLIAVRHGGLTLEKINWPMPGKIIFSQLGKWWENEEV